MKKPSTEQESQYLRKFMSYGLTNLQAWAWLLALAGIGSGLGSSKRNSILKKFQICGSSTAGKHSHIRMRNVIIQRPFAKGHFKVHLHQNLTFSRFFLIQKQEITTFTPLSEKT